MNAPIFQPEGHAKESQHWQHYLATTLICGLSAAIMTPFMGHLDLANIVMVFLLVVVLIALKLGRDCAVFSAVLNVVLFDLLFVPPRFSLAVENSQYLITFAVMLITALTIGHLTANLKKNEKLALVREKRTNDLFALASQLAGALEVSQVQALAKTFVAQQFGAKCFLIITNDDFIPSDGHYPDIDFFIESHMATAALLGSKTVHSTAVDKSGWASIYIPLRAAMRKRGVLAVSLPDKAQDKSIHVAEEDIALMEAMSALMAITLERLHYVDVVNSAEIDVAQERLRASILSALSHDLRTPLTVMMGLADAIHLIKPPASASVLDIAHEIQSQAKRLSNHVSNLLDLARLNDGEIKLRKEWHSIPEILGASIQYLGTALAHHTVEIQMAPKLPLVQIDAVLMERVFSNLLENAAKFSPQNSRISVTGHLAGDQLVVTFQNPGEGFDAQTLETLFQPFSRGASLPSSGFGLGLSICKIVMESHGGKIEAFSEANLSVVRLTFKSETPPILEFQE
jgi:two-component system, OmpR family, sensor histidine kinase KdpD